MEEPSYRSKQRRVSDGAFHDRLLRAKERWDFAEGYCATFTLKLRAFIRAFFERS